MDRRELLKRIAVLTGASVVGGQVFLSGCAVEPKDDGPFTAAVISFLDEVGETIIPETDTPGAKAAKVGEFMKVMITDCYTPAEQDAFIAGVAALDEYSVQNTQKGFLECSPEEKKSLLESLLAEAKDFNAARKEADEARKAEAVAAGTEFVATPPHYMTMMKQLTLWGFFTSETGMTETLRHLPVPGRYDGNAPYTPGEKAWAE
jgi:hypothetical protein